MSRHPNPPSIPGFGRQSGHICSVGFTDSAIKPIIIILIIFLTFILHACSNEIIDGVWRQTLAPHDTITPGAPIPPVAYELVLAQYGPDVAGYVWFYDQASTSNTEDNPFGWPTYCKLLQHGRYDEEAAQLGFSFNDEHGFAYSAWLHYNAQTNSLTGTLRPSNAQDNSSPMQVSFTRISKDINSLRGRCADMTAVHVRGHVEIEDVHAYIKPTVALVYIGTFLSQPFSFVAASVPVSDAGSFAFTLDKKPSSKALAVDTQETSFGYGVFLLFDDEDQDGAWKYREWLNSDSEPVLGTSEAYALTWIEGEISPSLSLPTSLVAELPQGYTLVRVVKRDDHIVGLEPIAMENGTPSEDVLIVPDMPVAVPDIFNMHP